ncbi:putative mucin-associated surface protein (MASP) [Trypanosoma theileri]|uniref:Putative mucin-associated surface protein (MASP) n=1 Tax=Trypanosoma theileri TaxID=67003 RepID=A0A1X0P5H5_9TRYP|nr:putative mucin-associated surface protein (MASP) [Trypanosoma theileri]ORC91799.1 putative mucin-associated surface protein (MASP) [Trypanosoma theileri]
MNKQDFSGERDSQPVMVASDTGRELSHPRQNDSHLQETTDLFEFRGELERISNSTTSVSRILESLCQYNVLFSDEPVMELINDIEMEEEFVFSQVPEYLKNEWKRINPTKKETEKLVESKVDTVATYNSEQRRRADYGASSRLVVDPSIPLIMPFSKERHNMTNPEYKSVQGNYHSLFFGEGEPVVFTPPQDNKRKEIERQSEERTYWKSKFKRPEKNNDVQPKKPKVVPRDFVPSCAYVENLPAHKRPSQERVVEKKPR